MKQTDPHFKLRLPPDLKEKIERASAASQRSMSAEIVARLAASFDDIPDRVLALENLVGEGGEYPADRMWRDIQELEEKLSALRNYVSRGGRP